ncbi:MAG: radical SAM protein, partial [Elusimicrobia bacterium]|nr:radical SAM protein [Elusimicrobiota bacterium]
MSASPAAVPLPTKTSLETLGDFYVRPLGKGFLLTNDWGYYLHLGPDELRRFVEGRLSEGQPLWRELKSKGFLRKHLDLKDLASKFASHNSYLWRGPNLHIVVVTLRCNLKCVYCHSSVVGEKRREFDMTQKTARRVVDFIFESPNPDLTIEFQGGEPLLNWEVVRFIARYSRKKAQEQRRNLKLALVSNFTLLDEDKLKELSDLGVAMCTSFDGPPAVHDHNRIYLGGNGHASVAHWIERILSLGLPTGALMTTTRRSLSHPRAIVDEYSRLGLREIFLRPLHYLGFARRSWETIGYRDEEFIAFY